MLTFCSFRYGLRPSAGRLPYEGMANSMDGQNTILSVVGPLGGSVGALKIATKALLEKEPWLHDPLVVEMPWREEQEDVIKKEDKLSFGIMRSDGLVGLHPPIERALDIVVEAVKKLGHDVVEWKPPSHKPIMDLAVSNLPQASVNASLTTLRPKHGALMAEKTVGPSLIVLHTGKYDG